MQETNTRNAISRLRIGATSAEGGTRGHAIEVGGQDCLPFHHFEGVYPNRPAVAWEIPDIEPGDWPDAVKEPYRDCLGDPLAWASLVTERYGAKLLCLNLRGTHPDKENKSAEEAAGLVRELLRRTPAPLIVQGPGAGEKQNEVLTACAEAAQGERCVLASALEDHYKTAVAGAMAYGHLVVAETPIDVNLCKQLNRLITDLNFPADRILIDPLTGGLGYGLEYTYSVMERIRLQALSGDPMMRMPFICFVGQEVWKAKEVKVPAEKEPLWGPRDKRGVLWETATAVSLLLAGADVLVMRHPEAVAAAEWAIDELMAPAGSGES